MIIMFLMLWYQGVLWYFGSCTRSILVFRKLHSRYASCTSSSRCTSRHIFTTTESRPRQKQKELHCSCHYQFYTRYRSMSGALVVIYIIYQAYFTSILYGFFTKLFVCLFVVLLAYPVVLTLSSCCSFLPFFLYFLVGLGFNWWCG